MLVEAIFLSTELSLKQLHGGVESGIPGIPSLYTKAFLNLSGWVGAWRTSQ